MVGGAKLISFAARPAGPRRPAGIEGCRTDRTGLSAAVESATEQDDWEPAVITARQNVSTPIPGRPCTSIQPRRRRRGARPAGRTCPGRLTADHRHGPDRPVRRRHAGHEPAWDQTCSDHRHNGKSLRAGPQGRFRLRSGPSNNGGLIRVVLISCQPNPLSPEQQTSADRPGMSEKGQRTKSLRFSPLRGSKSRETGSRG
jgi:hypothetical protein